MVQPTQPLVVQPAQPPVHQATGSAASITIPIFIALAVIALLIWVLLTRNGQKASHSGRLPRKKPTSHSSQTPPSVNDVDVVCVAMILKKNIGNDPITHFQKAHSYWIGLKEKWEKKCCDVKLETFDTIKDIDGNGFVLVIYKTKCPKDHIPQGVLGIQNALRNKNIPPHYTLLPPETGTFLHDFK